MAIFEIRQHNLRAINHAVIISRDTATTLLKMVNYVLTITHVLTTYRRNLIEPRLLHGTISIIIYQMSETYPL